MCLVVVMTAAALMIMVVMMLMLVMIVVIFMMVMTVVVMMMVCSNTECVGSSEAGCLVLAFRILCFVGISCNYTVGACNLRCYGNHAVCIYGQRCFYGAVIGHVNQDNVGIYSRLALTNHTEGDW